VAFGGSGLTYIALTNNVSSIGYKAFSSCASLTNVVLGSAITNITMPAFFFCENLASISVDPANSFYASSNGILFNIDLTTLLVFPAGRTGSYTIPGIVTNLEDRAFQCTSLTSVSIPDNIIDIGDRAFQHGTNMVAITVGSANPNYCDMDGVLFNKNHTTLIQYPAGKTNVTYTVPHGVLDIGNGSFTRNILSHVILPNTVTNIGQYAFELSVFSSITIPDSVKMIERLTFKSCPNLNSIYFTADPPGFETSLGTTATAYFLPGSSQWGTFFGGCPTVLWNPVMQLGSGYGATPGGFSFNITGTADIPVRIEACTNLAEGVWIPLLTTTLSGSSLDISDEDWNSHPSRLYRITGP
jgi:hypothetical protein